jgi:hypothetical protein
MAKLFQVPHTYFTVKGNPRSEEVLQQIEIRLANQSFANSFEDGNEPFPQECVVFHNEESVTAFFEGGAARGSAVAIFDRDGNKNRSHSFTTSFRANNEMPKWAIGCHWAIKVFAGCRPNGNFQRNCVEQATAHFNRNFLQNLRKAQYPWGAHRKGENPPVDVGIPRRVVEQLARLNSGPNLAAAIADKEFALELPKGSHISWIRISHDPLICDLEKLQAASRAMADFEPVCNSLVYQDKTVQERLFAGVDIDPALRQAYLFPSATKFSVRRPDLHFTGQGVFASENDEMPGGFAELAFLDHENGISQERWKKCFNWLTKDGRLLFLVSHEWSKCYITEISWLAQHLQEQGCDVGFLTTDRMNQLDIRPDGVYDQSGRIATIWRQFPIFEAHGKLVDLVLSAQAGKVRLVPEFAHYGNKVWFSIFRSHNSFFRENLPATSFELLDKLLPDSHLVRSENDFPFSVSGIHVQSVEELANLPATQRDGLVMKLSGANSLTARSYGVIMGHGLTQKTWQEWIAERMEKRQPFIVQKRLETGTIDLPVLNTSKNIGELFHCRVLLRPWIVGDEIVSVHACAVPSNTLRVHGRVDMCVPSVQLV